eukprot:1953894-Alexandrium_andersonii.AAC.1
MDEIPALVVDLPKGLPGLTRTGWDDSQGHVDRSECCAPSQRAALREQQRKAQACAPAPAPPPL